MNVNSRDLSVVSRAFRVPVLTVVFLELKVGAVCLAFGSCYPAMGVLFLMKNTNFLTRNVIEDIYICGL